MWIYMFIKQNLSSEICNLPDNSWTPNEVKFCTKTPNREHFTHLSSCDSTTLGLLKYYTISAAFYYTKVDIHAYFTSWLHSAAGL